MRCLANKGHSTGFVLVMLLCTPGILRSQSVPQNNKLVHQALDDAGVLPFLQRMPPFFEQVAAQVSPAKLPPDIEVAVHNAVSEAFAPAKLTAALEDSIEKQVDGKMLAEFLKWFTTPFAKKVIAVETAAGDLSMAERQKFMQTVESNPPGPDRVEIIRQLESAIHSTDLMVNAMISVMRGTKGVLQIVDPKQASAISDVANAQRDLQTQMEQVTVLNYLFTYRSLSNEELRSYVEFLASPPTKAFYDALGNAYNDVFNHANDDLIARVRRSFAGSMHKPKDERYR